MEEIDIPQYFLCPISLQIMKDPVTTVTGITYDRECIEQWLSTAAAATAVCPVTKLPLSKSSGLTPNHMLRRLIQGWCIANAKSGIDRIPTPKETLHRAAVLKLIRGVGSRRSSAENLEALAKMEELASDGEKNQKCMAEAGAAKSMLSYLMRCSGDGNIAGVDRALRILRLTWSPTAENKQIVEEKLESFIQSIAWILNSKVEETAKTDALILLKNVVQAANPSFFEKMKPCFFKELVKILRKETSAAATRAVLKTLIETCPAGRNRTKIVEAGAVFELIEMELGSPEKKTTELIFCLLAHLCSCADGRQQFLRHAGGVGLVAKRLLRVSPATDDRALCIYESIARFSATQAVVAEMLTVAGVTKLCMILQAECDVYLKKKAREILRLHSKVWSNSPCIQLYLLTRYSR